MSTNVVCLSNGAHHIKRNYRSELDGLRAVAVLAVLANHAAPKWLESGFLGVDVFFVLSGYVVAHSWHSRSNSNAREFYRRRIRRLQPALLLVLICTSIIALPLALLTPANQITAVSALIGASNLTLLNQSLDYFGAAAGNNPFTHTWSLGVEEQFYLAFPLLVRKRRLLIILCCAALVLWFFLQLQQPEASFYLMPARLWELGLGILLLQFEQRNNNPPSWMSTLGLAGLLLTFYMPLSMQIISTPFAVLSSASLIHGLTKSNWLKNAFQTANIVAIGKRAYGIYLWHWPLLVLTRAQWPDERLLNSALPLALTFIIAEASYRWLEQPLRSGNWGFKAAAVLVTTSAALVTSISWLANQKSNGPSWAHFSDSHRQALTEQQCHSSKRSDALSQCLAKNSNLLPKIILIGDSHAAHLQPLLDEFKVEVAQLTDRNLPNLWLGQSCREPAYCMNKAQVLQQLNRVLNPQSVVILGLSPRRLTGPKRTASQTKQSLSKLKDSLNALINVVEKNQSQLLLLGGLPQTSCPRGLGMNILFNRGGPQAVSKLCSPSTTQAIKQNQPQLDLYNALKGKHPKHVNIFNSLTLFCDNSICPLTNPENQLLMWDELAHLTPAGLEKIRDPLQEKIKNLLTKVPPSSP